MTRTALLALTLFLVACGSVEAPPDSQSAESESDVAAVLPTATMVEPTATKSTSPEPSGSITDLLISEFVPATSMEQANAVRPTDHVLGASDPVVTIIEYGDFQ